MKSRKTKTTDDLMPPAADVPLAADVPPSETDIVLSALADAAANIEKILDDLQDKIKIGTILTGAERRRLNGAKARNYGFIVHATDIARAYPGWFLPYQFPLDDMTTDRNLLEQARQMTHMLEQLRTFTDDFLLKKSDTLYRNALNIYHLLKMQVRSKVPGAEELCQQLSPHFKGRGKRDSGKDKSTGKEVKK